LGDALGLGVCYFQPHFSEVVLTQVAA